MQGRIITQSEERSEDKDNCMASFDDDEIKSIFIYGFG